jgi:hypothetical protein
LIELTACPKTVEVPAIASRHISKMLMLDFIRELM